MLVGRLLEETVAMARLHLGGPKPLALVPFVLSYDGIILPRVGQAARGT
jgi:hypothetical protein